MLILPFVIETCSISITRTYIFKISRNLLAENMSSILYAWNLISCYPYRNVINAIISKANMNS